MIESHFQIFKDSGFETPFLKKYNRASKNLENGYIMSLYDDFMFLSNQRDFEIHEASGTIVNKSIKVQDIKSYIDSSISEIVSENDEIEYKAQYIKMMREIDTFYINKTNNKKRSK